MSERDTEVTALESIFGDLLSVQKRADDSVLLEMNVRPIDGGIHSPPTIRVTLDVASQVFMCRKHTSFMRLMEVQGADGCGVYDDFASAGIEGEYPNVSPKVRLWQPRGVDDKHVAELSTRLAAFLDENLGMPVLFDVFGTVQAYLENIDSCPSGSCPMCLTDFSSQLPSIRTHCDHYVHQPCFANYVDFSRREIQRQLAEWPEDMKHKVDQALRCPMCREELDDEDCHKADEREGVGRWVDPNEYHFDWDDWRRTQRKWALLMARQRANGGIIDVDAESHRYLVTDSTVLESRTSSELSQDDRGGAVSRATSNNTSTQRGGVRRGWPRRNGDREPRVAEASEREELCSRFNRAVRVGGNKPKYAYRRGNNRRTTGTRTPSHHVDGVGPPPGFEHRTPHLSGQHPNDQ